MKNLYINTVEFNRYIESKYHTDIMCKEIIPENCSEMLKELVDFRLLYFMSEEEAKSDKYLVPIHIYTPLIGQSEIGFIDECVGSGIDKVTFMGGPITKDVDADIISIAKPEYLVTELCKRINIQCSRAGLDAWDCFPQDKKSLLGFNISKYFKLETIPLGMKFNYITYIPGEMLVFIYPFKHFMPVDKKIIKFDIRLFSSLKLMHDRKENYSEEDIMNQFHIISQHDIRIEQYELLKRTIDRFYSKKSK